jgi:beta-glucosidase
MLVLMPGVFLSQEKFPFQDPSLPLEKRVEDLISRMTLEEKGSQMMENAPGISRLGVPPYVWWNEALHGVARAGLATVFPQAIGMAATWDPDLMFRAAAVISDEARAKHHEAARQDKRWYYQGLTFWSPNINIFRDPRWGRGQETYGEDPFLTGRMGVAFVKGLQGNDLKYLKAAATAKHYAVHSGPESLRHTFDARVDDRDLRETYLPAFRDLVREAKVESVMCAYNRFRGEPACASPFLLTGILRQEWGFQGHVVSDCGAVDDIYLTHKTEKTVEAAAAASVKAGCELNCGTGSWAPRDRQPFAQLPLSVKQGMIEEKEVDAALKRLFTTRFKLGLFDPPEMVPYARIPYSSVDSPENRQVALEAARKSLVLLKNERNTLPLSRKLKTLAVIGPNADEVDVLLGNYNGFPSRPVTILEGIREKVGKGTRVLYAKGSPLAEGLPNFEVVPASALFSEEGGKRRPGLKGEYYQGYFEGQPLLTQQDRVIQFDWKMGAPKEGMGPDNFSVRWSGELVPAVSGDYSLGAFGFDEYDLFLEGQKILQARHVHEPSLQSKAVRLEAGKHYPIRIEYFNRRHDAHFKLLWDVPGRGLERPALRAARQADAVVMVMGLSPRLEGEEMNVPVRGFKGGDREMLDLPEIQQKLMEKVTALGKPVVLVLMSGSAVSINWANQNLPAILGCWYPGQAGGIAVADVLFGDYNPAGRLPVTFYQSADQLPPFEDYNMKGRTYRYFSGEPLYPFGHGLSYSTFRYSRLEIPQQASVGENVEVAVEVENAGPRAGEEVVQLYLSNRSATVPVPIRALKGFRRISLNPGEKTTVRFTLSPRDFSLIDGNSSRVVEPGKFEISLGGKQPGFKGTADNPTTEVVTGQLELGGDSLTLEP